MAISEPRATSPYVGRRMTLDEFLKLPEAEPALEYEDGVVMQKATPQGNDCNVRRVLSAEIASVSKHEGLGMVFAERRFTTAGWSSVPDISFWMWEHADPPAEDRFEDLDASPSITAEVTSRRRGFSALLRKCIRHVELGVRLAVLVAVEERTVFVFRPERPVAVLDGPNRIDLSDVLPTFDLTVDALFSTIC